MVRMIAGRLIEEPEEPGTIVVNPVVTFNPSASIIEFTLKEWNRDFEKGNFDEWTDLVDAEISTADPYEGDYCCRLKKDYASITQTLDEPLPVTAVYEFSAWFKRKVPGNLVILQMNHTDGSTNQVGWALSKDVWERVYFDRSEMRLDKILSGITISSRVGDFFVDKVVLALATEVITGAVDAHVSGNVSARPKGSILETSPEAGVTTIVGTYQTVASHTPEDGYKLELAKILVSCPQDIMYRLRWDGEVISAPVYVTGGIPFTDWFPWDYYEMEGDDTKTFEIQVQAPAGGTPGVCHAEIVGEDVRSGFNL